MSIKDAKSGKAYVIVVPASAIFQITFGKDAKRSLPELDNVSVGDVVRCRVRLAEDEDLAIARGAIRVTAGKS